MDQHCREVVFSLRRSPGRGGKEEVGVRTRKWNRECDVIKSRKGTSCPGRREQSSVTLTDGA